MIRHNLLLIMRTFKRFKGTFLINLAGLSTGLTCTFLIALWVMDERAIDRFHAGGDRLYRVMVNNEVSGKIITSPSTQAILGEALLSEVPEVDKAVTTLADNFDMTISHGMQHVMRRGSLVDAEFLEIFSYDLIMGNTNALAGKGNIVLSESSAVALFGSASEAIGRLVTWEFLFGKGEAMVTAVLKDIPDNSSFKTDFLMSFDIYKDIVGEQDLHWGNFGCNTYLLLKPNASMEIVNNKIADLVKRRSPGARTTLFLMPYAEYYLHSRFSDGRPAGGRIEYVRLFSLIGIVILTLACINFMNLATAKASRRIREIGVKKAIGADRATLIAQYLGESILMTCLSVLVAILMADLLMPTFNQITGKHLQLGFNLPLLVVIGVITLITGLLAGSHPAIYLSGFSPAAVLKGRFIGPASSPVEMLGRKGLIVFQFVISIVFIVVVWVIHKQIDFVQHKDLGYDKDQLIYVKPEGNAAANMETFLTGAKKLTGVVNASSIAGTIVGSLNSTVGYFHWEGKDPDAIIPFAIVNGNYDLIETLGVEMQQGRTFDRDHGTDSASIILNAAAIEVMGMKEPVGKTFNLWGKDLTIMGVTKDFHFQSLHEKVTPLFFRLVPREADRILIRLERGKEHDAIASLERLYRQFNPEFTFTYTFVNQDYQAQYVSEQRISALSRYFAGLAIIISCLGLFGLAAFTAERRLKEIGIRKVLGSGEWRIVYLLSADFTRIVLLACLVALPLSYLIARTWLDGFAYKIVLAWWYFPASGLLALTIALLTVGIQAVKAASVNPVQCLKDE